MPILPALIIVEIVSVFVVSSANPYSVSKLRHDIVRLIPQVLAQDATPSAETSTPTPDNASSAPSQDTGSNSSQPTDQSTSSSIEQTAPGEPSPTTEGEPQGTNSESSLMNEINSSPSPQSQTQTNESNPTNTPEALPNTPGQTSKPITATVEEPVVSQASSTILNSSDIIGGPAEEVDEKTVENAQKQDEEIEKAKDPVQAGSLSIDFAKDSVKEAENHIRSDDFSTTSFVVQRISEQIDTASFQTQKTGSAKLSGELSSLCRQTDLVLKSQQLVVPEEGEQDFEIVRGKCLNITQ